jgi:aminoglycoside phosphotransferase (APT) family kinase protein
MPPPSPVPVHGFDLSPEDELLLRGPLPGAARAWVREVVGPGARIVSVHPRAGGTSSAVHAVTVDDGSGDRHELILRRYVRADWFAREPDLAEHEARVLELLAPSPVVAPELFGVDPTGARCDVPAVLMTRLPGRVRWSPKDIDGFVDGLVEAMLTIHAVPVPDPVAIRAFSPYYEHEELAPPPGTSCPADWERAIEVHAGPPPTHERVFIHRDFHPGNVLWVGDALTGVVDWVNASLGSPEADVGHCRINVARHLGYEVAERLTARYLARSGRGDYHPYWDLVDAVGMLDYTGPELGWLPSLDDSVRRAVARLG